ncbi:bifunctional methylenetetrahydrofolate dehydrogenase/cyclohydrolase, mitochondrial [Cloeon dipterum]|uniref:bifunctional methylenetetrahydrofolate dehydrogenase/cyclohydrolase, mitochondrial n=1 Tax=Cloeon dipterum TaxID=197152 RepID=UPI00321F6740
MKPMRLLLTLNSAQRQYSKSFHHSSHRLSATILDGRKHADKILGQLKNEVNQWIDQGHKRPNLTALLVGENPASNIYVRKKMQAASLVGIKSNTIKLPLETTESDLLEIISSLNNSPSIDGILVQLPLPGHISERMVCNAIDPSKDVDGFHSLNMGRMCLGIDTFVPCTALAVVELIKLSGIETKGRRAVVCGRSKNVGMPIAVLLHSDSTYELGGMDATVTYCHRYTPFQDLLHFTRNADILVSCTGIPKLITAHMVKPGACVIDVGLNRTVDPVTKKTKISGDVDFSGVAEVASFLTPVPGGVGPMTVAMLMRNTFLACKRIYSINQAV